MDDRDRSARYIRQLLDSAIRELRADVNNAIGDELPNEQPPPRRLREEMDAHAEIFDVVLLSLNQRVAWIRHLAGGSLERAHLASLSPERLASIVQEVETLTSGILHGHAFLGIFPDNPVNVLDTSGQAMAPRLNRLYLDVTDASRQDVDEIWTLVEWLKMGYRQRGLPASPGRGAPKGPRRGGDVERWVRRAGEVGEEAAHQEFKAESSPGRGAWASRAQWWRRHVRPRLQKSR